MSTATTIVDEYGQPLKVNGKPHQPKPRPELLEAMLANRAPRRAKSSFDAARDSTEYQAHWANSDALDADSANNKEVRHTLMRRSRYERGSNGFYDGIMETNCNMVVGVGPTLRMLTGNRNFNQLVEREFFKWYQRVQLRRKLWCMAHARTQDGEAFAILQTNPNVPIDQVQLDVVLIEGEQCQTPFLPFLESGHIDGIKFDKFDNILWYDVLPTHPGSANQFFNQDAVRVAPRDMLHWFKMDRPGTHRNKPAMTSTLNVGASARRMREATLAAAETAADLNVMLTSQLTPDSVTDPIAPLSTLPIQKRMMTAAPSGWDAHHFKSEHPAATYEGFNRSLVSEQARPISMPYNAAACDSSTYSFASGKLDTLCYRAAIDVERQDCNDLVLDPLFAAWFREWTIVTKNVFIPNHQWDWPRHPVIDDVADATATHQRLADGTLSYRQAFSDQGQDIEDQLAIQAEDAFGEANDETILKARQMMILRTTPQAALPFVAQLLGIESPVAGQPQENQSGDAEMARGRDRRAVAGGPGSGPQPGGGGPKEPKPRSRAEQSVLRRPTTRRRKPSKTPASRPSVAFLKR